MDAKKKPVPVMLNFLVFLLMRLSAGGLTLLRTLARSVGIFHKLRHYVPLGTLYVSIYHASFYPFLIYGIVGWGATNEILKPVLTAQKKVIRAITFSEPTAHSSLFIFGSHVFGT